LHVSERRWTVRLRLERQEWLVGELLGGGGFGQVYAAESASGDTGALKLVPKAPGAQRELLFEDLAGARNIVPIIDLGETADYWVIVMPRATKSLQQYLSEVGSRLEVANAVPILVNIATALVDLDGRVVHRDLKPENILLFNERWCLADFGIARYAEATTAPDTRMYAMSPPYAAPERWQDERATSAADVYALGVIAYELLAGSRPFPGPELSDFREQHLYLMPPSLPGVPSRLEALVQECLFKPPAARPSPANLLARLEGLAQSHTSSAGLRKLQDVNLDEVRRRSDEARLNLAVRSEVDRRDSLLQAATMGLARISDTLRETIREHASTAAVQQESGGWTIRLKQAQLQFTPPTKTSATIRGGWVPALAINVIAHASIIVTMPGVRSSFPLGPYTGRSHSLWFCNARKDDEYRWFETAFLLSPLTDPINLSLYITYKGDVKRGYEAPFSLDVDQDLAQFMSSDINRFQVAWPFTEVITSELLEFNDRWASWLADAAQGGLQPPR
jgi:eukaryotic-like serine/threonine-protein kinase